MRVTASISLNKLMMSYLPVLLSTFFLLAVEKGQHVSAQQAVIPIPQCLHEIQCTASNLLLVDNATSLEDNIPCPDVADYIMAAVGRSVNQYGYRERILPPLSRAPYQDFVYRDVSLTPRLGLCDVDCDRDDQCAPGLWCASDHGQTLKRMGYNLRKANCGNVGKTFDEVCFDKRIITGRRLGSMANQTDEEYFREIEMAEKTDLSQKKSRTQRGARQSPSSMTDSDSDSNKELNRSPSRKLQTVSNCKCNLRCRTAKNLALCAMLSCSHCTRRRKLQGGSYNMTRMIEIAENELRYISRTWTNITNPTCQRFLQNATCSSV